MWIVFSQLNEIHVMTWAIVDWNQIKIREQLLERRDGHFSKQEMQKTATLVCLYNSRLGK